MIILGIIVIICIIILGSWYFSHLVNPTDNKVERKIDKTLIVYFSTTGKTKKLAKLLQDQTNSDIVELKGTKGYTENDKKRAFIEWVTGATPELKMNVQNLEEYDLIYLTYPIWFDTAPMIVKQFIKGSNLSNKYIVPVVTFNRFSHGEGRSIRLIRRHAPRAKVLPRLILENDNKDSQRITAYLKEVGIK